MKYILLISFILSSVLSKAQNMTAEEKHQRAGADFTAFLNEVKKNSIQSCLCKAFEYVVFSVNTRSNKMASLCVSKNLSPTAGYLVYRFGTKAKIELTYPADTLNSLTQFSFAHYNRGGGKQNAAMYVNSFRFSNAGFTYSLNDDWSSEDNQYSKRITITNNKTGKSTTMDAKGKATGTLQSLINKNIVRETDEL